MKPIELLDRYHSAFIVAAREGTKAAQKKEEAAFAALQKRFPPAALKAAIKVAESSWALEGRDDLPPAQWKKLYAKVTKAEAEFVRALDD